ncbi:hypothetical protein LIER_39091 [Lithospermum erythrorhizon]|uniref:RNase H type-1 domain-containing protein n=1 Tax=Lithospermum erythrorhizon TaxID=34254 RepID=A0AAV3Q9K5_LITER
MCISLGNCFKVEHWRGDLDKTSIFNCLLASKLVKRCIICSWTKPDTRRFKLNVDGSSKGNPDISGGEGILRNDSGDMLFAFTRDYGRHSSLLSEFRALLEGLKVCLSYNIKGILIESDSKCLINMISTGSWPWYLSAIGESIVTLMASIEAVLHHVFRVSNSAADWLANFGVQCLHDQDFSSLEHDHLRSLCAIVKLDTDGVSFIRNRYSSLSFSVPQVM